jgi:hypothetical protein
MPPSRKNVPRIRREGKGKSQKAREPDEVTATRRVLSKAHDNNRQKCENPKNRHYPSYGGRGITMHPLWRNDCQLFIDQVLNEIGPRPTPQHSLDRKDNNRNYEPGNLRWATRAEQASNRRSTTIVEIGGITIPRPIVAKSMGVTPKTIAQRANRQLLEDPRITAFEDNWNSVIQEMYGRFPVTFTREQKLETAKAFRRLTSNADLIRISTAAIYYWDHFARAVEQYAGVVNIAYRPKIEFFLKNLEVAVDFWPTARAYYAAERREKRSAEYRQRLTEAELHDQNDYDDYEIGQANEQIQQNVETSYQENELESEHIPTVKDKVKKKTKIRMIANMRRK